MISLPRFDAGSSGMGGGKSQIARPHWYIAAGSDAVRATLLS